MGAGCHILFFARPEEDYLRWTRAYPLNGNMQCAPRPWIQAEMERSRLPQLFSRSFHTKVSETQMSSPLCKTTGCEDVTAISLSTTMVSTSRE